MVLQHAARQNSKLCRENKMKKSKNQPVRHPASSLQQLKQKQKTMNLCNKNKDRNKQPATRKEKKTNKSSCAAQGVSYSTTPMGAHQHMQDAGCDKACDRSYSMQYKACNTACIKHATDCIPGTWVPGYDLIAITKAPGPTRPTTCMCVKRELSPLFHTYLW